MDGMKLSAEAVNDKVRSDIEQYGWSIIASEFQGGIYAHTIGLEQSFKHPEIEVLGLNEELATVFLNELAKLVKQGTELKNGMTISDFVEGYELMLVTNPSDPNGEPTIDGRLRLIWPDTNHRYPWDNDCAADCSIQSLLPESLPAAD